MQLMENTRTNFRNLRGIKFALIGKIATLRKDHSKKVRKRESKLLHQPHLSPGTKLSVVMKSLQKLIQRSSRLLV
jgi:hypothetical protein